MICVAAALLLLATCRKAEKPNAVAVGLSYRHVEPHRSTADLTAVYDYLSELHGVEVKVSTNEKMKDDATFTGSVEGDTIKATMTGLTPLTHYYYQIVFDNGLSTLLSEIDTFTTLDISIPTVMTHEVTDITKVTATGHGEVIADGGAAVTEHGICWSLTHEPTLSDSHTTNGNGIGSFSVEMTNLTGNTTYYVRAYATNSQGTAYGNEVSFVSGAMLPVVVTHYVAYSGNGLATGNGEVTSDGGAEVTERGICWSTSHNPTTSDSQANNGIGIGSYTVSLTGLTPNTNYFARAYATNSQGTAYGNEISFTSSSGILTGVFSVSATTKVKFSQGNLQYQASTNTWRFAENQWDYVGGMETGLETGTVYENGIKCSNNLISSTYDGWIDLFGWGTSGYNHGASCYQPWNDNANVNGYQAYGSSTCNLFEQTGKADWGYNRISNGGNVEGKWRTLTTEEWDYLINGRTNASNLYGHGKIENINGFILLPDNWALPSGLNFTSGESMWTNSYTTVQWTLMESAGAIFLPITGYRVETDLYDTRSNGSYWSSSYSGPAHSNSLFFYSSGITPQCRSNRFCGNSVRLVHNIE